jgi:hypothetical protein
MADTDYFHALADEATDLDVTELFDGFPGNEDENLALNNEEQANEEERKFITHLMRQIGVRCYQPFSIDLTFGIVDEDILPELQDYIQKRGEEFIKSLKLDTKEKFGIGVMPQDEIQTRAKAALQAAVAVQWPPAQQTAQEEENPDKSLCGNE